MILYHLLAALLLCTDDDSLDRVADFPAVGAALAECAEADGLKTPGSGIVWPYWLPFLREYYLTIPLCPTLAEGDAVRRAAWLVQGQRDLGDDFQRHCTLMAEGEPQHAARWDALRLESVQACLAWELLAESLENGLWQDNAYQPIRRRLALQYLKARLGAEAFASGVMPSPVPVWAFTRIDP